MPPALEADRGSNAPPNSSNQLLKLKVKIKEWENNFFKVHLKKPSKEDIVNAPPGIQSWYQQYWKLRKLLEKSTTPAEPSIQAKQVPVDEEVWSYKLNKPKNGEQTRKGSLKENDSPVPRLCLKIEKAYLASNAKKPILSLKKLTRKESKDEKEKDVCPVAEEKQTQLDSRKELKNEEAQASETVTASDTEVSTSSAVGCLDITRQAEVDVLDGWKKPCIRFLERCSFFPSSPISVSSTSQVQIRKSKVDLEWLDRCNPSDEPEADKGDFRGSDEPYQDSSEYQDLEMEGLASKLEDLSGVLASSLLSQDAAAQNDVPDSEAAIPSCVSDCAEEYCHEEPSIFDVLENKVTRNGQQIKRPLSTEAKPSKRLKDDSEQNCCPGSDVKKKRHLPEENRGTSSALRNSSKKAAVATTLSDNFVRIDMKKKRYCKGKRRITPEQHKRMKWKAIQKSKRDGEEGAARKTTACFKCGEEGHWARSCPKQRGDPLMPKEMYEEMEDDPNASLGDSKVDLESVIDECDKLLGEGPLGIADANTHHDETARQPVEPLFHLDSTGRITDTPECVYEALKQMGHTAFRPGQEEAVMRILSGLSTLLVLPTGAGKSLCYQLPAYLYGQARSCITLVVSPLLSLMEDQLSRFPLCLSAVCVHSGMTPAQKDEAKLLVASGKAKVILVSPEAVVSGSLPHTFPDLPPVAFACIDEAHCISEWSDNFRPSYLQLYKILKCEFGVQCILALTATVTHATMLSVARNLGLSVDEGAVLGKTSVPDNLMLSVSRDRYRDEALISLLRGKRFRACRSIIVYCIRREETERLAMLIRTSLQSEQMDDSGPAREIRKSHASKKRILLWDAEAYHAGMSSSKRRSVQKRFMAGKLRVIVATVAFGMGLDKSDVQAVIHYNMPKSFESYVQEIGRAGRDGSLAHCHVFLSCFCACCFHGSFHSGACRLQGQDLPELQRHIYANSVDRHVLRKLLTKVFPSCRCLKVPSSSSKCAGHEVAFPIGSTVQLLDVPEEGIATFLSYLELHPKKWIQVLRPIYDTCTIHCYGGKQQLASLATSCKPVGVAMALKRRRGEHVQGKGSMQLSVVEVASAMGWDAHLVRKSLKELEWERVDGRSKRSGVLVEFSELSFHIRSPGNLTDEELDEILDFLHHRVVLREHRELARLREVFTAFTSTSHANCLSCSEEADVARSNQLKSLVQSYFDRDEADDACALNTEEEHALNMDQMDVSVVDQIRSDVRHLLCTHYRDHSFTARAVARIFHGIPSPCFPAEVWGKVRRSWRSHLETDFATIMRIAAEEILRLKSSS